MEFFEVLEKRHSIRSFYRRAISNEQEQAILEAANRAPSAGNLQSYEIYLVQQTGTLKDLARAALNQEFIAQAPLALVFCANPQRSIPRYGQRGRNLYCIQDATIACAYAQLAATALGLASVWVGAFDDGAVRKAIGVGEELVPVAILPVGYPAEKPRITRRRSLSDLVNPG